MLTAAGSGPTLWEPGSKAAILTPGFTLQSLGELLASTAWFPSPWGSDLIGLGMGSGFWAASQVIEYKTRVENHCTSRNFPEIHALLSLPAQQLRRKMDGYKQAIITSLAGCKQVIWKPTGKWRKSIWAAGCFCPSGLQTASAPGTQCGMHWVLFNCKRIDSVVPPHFSRGAQCLDSSPMRVENRQAAPWVWWLSWDPHGVGRVPFGQKVSFTNGLLLLLSSLLSF